MTVRVSMAPASGWPGLAVGTTAPGHRAQPAASAGTPPTTPVRHLAGQPPQHRLPARPARSRRTAGGPSSRSLARQRLRVVGHEVLVEVTAAIQPLAFTFIQGQLQPPTWPPAFEPTPCPQGGGVEFSKFGKVLCYDGKLPAYGARHKGFCAATIVWARSSISRTQRSRTRS
jgi:hypothetical protein